jgi:DNA invertase Pin-like site-specific DNA recombinase
MALAEATRPPTATTKGSPSVCVAAYTRVSTTEQANEGAGLEAQAHAIAREAERRGWPPVCLYTDAGISGKAMDGRDALRDALAYVEAHRGSLLVVARLDRLTRSLGDFAELLERSRRRGWSLVALDLNVDTSTPSGEMLANVVASVAQYERRLIGVRTKDAMAVHKLNGAQYGRRRGVPERVCRYIVRLRAAGASYASIASRLNARRVATSYGGKRWYASTVRVVTSYSEVG